MQTVYRRLFFKDPWLIPQVHHINLLFVTTKIITCPMLTHLWSLRRVEKYTNLISKAVFESKLDIIFDFYSPGSSHCLEAYNFTQVHQIKPTICCNKSKQNKNKTYQVLPCVPSLERIEILWRYLYLVKVVRLYSQDFGRIILQVIFWLIQLPTWFRRHTINHNKLFNYSSWSFYFMINIWLNVDQFKFYKFNL